MYLMEFCVRMIIVDWKRDVNLALDIYLYALYILKSQRSRSIRVYRNLEHLKIFYTNTDSMFLRKRPRNFVFESLFQIIYTKIKCGIRLEECSKSLF
jgi:hypothetical protein